jgi:hypothetical protein
MCHFLGEKVIILIVKGMKTIKNVLPSFIGLKDKLAGVCG